MCVWRVGYMHVQRPALVGWRLLCVPLVVSCLLLHSYVTKRLSSWAGIGNPKPEQETIEGTCAQETPAYQRRPTTLSEVQGSNPPIRALTCS